MAGAGVAVLSAAVVNLLPFESLGHTEMLAALHLPIALWLTVEDLHPGFGLMTTLGFQQGPGQALEHEGR